MLIYFLIFLSLVLLVYLLLWKHQIRSIVREINSIQEDEPTQRLLTQELTSKEVTLLVSAINGQLLEKRAHEKRWKKEEERLRRSLTHLSHDLRTPLASIEGFFHLMQHAESEEDRLRYEAILSERVGRTRELVNQYFYSLKYESEELSLPLSPLHPEELLLQSLLSFTAQFDAKKWEPLISLQAPSAIIDAHEESLLRLFQNLIQNALTHGTAPLTLQTEVKDDHYHVIFDNEYPASDNLDPNQLFDGFYKGDAARSADSTGLGLSIAKGLTRHMRGEIDIELIDHHFQVHLRFPLH